MDRLYLETKVMADDAGIITGMAWPFATADRVGDMIEAGAFKGVKLPIPMLFGHDMSDPIGTWETATEKADGLHVTGKMLINDVARAREVHALVKAGAVKGISIGFLTKKSVSRAGGGRTIKSLELFEVSLVTIGMHPGAKVTSAKSATQALRLIEAINRANAQLATR